MTETEVGKLGGVGTGTWNRLVRKMKGYDQEAG